MKWNWLCVGYHGEQLFYFKVSLGHQNTTTMMITSTHNNNKNGTNNEMKGIKKGYKGRKKKGEKKRRHEIKWIKEWERGNTLNQIAWEKKIG